jgi:hypothetical protein
MVQHGLIPGFLRRDVNLGNAEAAFYIFAAIVKTTYRMYPAPAHGKKQSPEASLVASLPMIGSYDYHVYRCSDV